MAKGGILALTALVLRRRRPHPLRSNVGVNGQSLLIVIGLFGAALFYGDGMITPAISVLSAVEGTKRQVTEPRWRRWSSRIAIIILVGLFSGPKAAAPLSVGQGSSAR
jgi:KUP system potassium uptake protein